MKNKLRYITIIFIVFIFTLNVIPIALAKTRRAYLTDFILQTEVHGEGFKNGIDGENPIIEATSYALEILDLYGLNAHDITDLESNLEADLEQMFDDNNVVLYDLYFLRKSLDILEYPIDPQLKNRIHEYLNQTEQVGGGFSFSNTTTLASLSSTYFIVKLYSLIGESVPNTTIHRDWVLLCNNSDGGYGGNKSLTSTILNTYYAVSVLDELGFINYLVDEDQTLTYLNTFYIQNPSDTENHGGYLPDITANYPLLSSTYFAIKAISIINETSLNKNPTILWVLNRQNFQDGGFADISQGTDQLSSSIFSSYYAFGALMILDPSLSKLSSEVFMVEFNYWILIIIFACIGLVVGIGVIIWKRRRI
ncbi:MAG: prenyltransferase/squalene oxidase repeat-containing protein [Candidatus Hermodarchaeota archaeon]